MRFVAQVRECESKEATSHFARDDIGKMHLNESHAFI